MFAGAGDLMIWLPPIFETLPEIQRVALLALRTTIPGRSRTVRQTYSQLIPASGSTR